MKTYLVLGMMSGTSLDGLDLAYCHFSKKQSQWNYTIEKAVTIPYPKEWKKILRELPNKSALEFVRTDADYGAFLGEQAIKFIENERFNPDFLSSHGHTIFHQPDLGYTCQIGSGASIAARSGFDVVCDFRSLDVAYAGQGAP